jgi:hyaluronan synthase
VITYRARRARLRIIAAATVVIAALTVWAIRHAISMIDTLHRGGHRFGMIYTLAFCSLVWQTILCNLERPRRMTARQRRRSDAWNVTVSVPVYNEDERLLVRCLYSLLDQTRLPDHIHVVDDGSKVSYERARAWFLPMAAEMGVGASWVRTTNGGKRHAQGVTIRATPDADVYVTVDSDAILDRHAIAEGLKPFSDAKVQSVAGVFLAVNSRRNLLTRCEDLWVVTGQLVDRSAASAMGAVLVNSGVLAFYRAQLLRGHLEAYLGETIAGRPVKFSDDSMLTTFAQLAGKTVQQPTAIAFTAMPENVGHHLRQYLRWMRGSTIRTAWRFRYLRVTSYAYWAHAVAWMQTAIATVTWVAVFVVQPVIDGALVPSLLLIPVLVVYGQSLRYLSVRRSDESVWSQLATVALAPLMMLWVMFVLRLVRWYAMATCLKTGWGTRADVEVGLAQL